MPSFFLAEIRSHQERFGASRCEGVSLGLYVERDGRVVAVPVLMDVVERNCRKERGKVQVIAKYLLFFSLYLFYFISHQFCLISHRAMRMLSDTEQQGENSHQALHSITPCMLRIDLASTKGTRLDRELALGY